MSDTILATQPPRTLRLPRWGAILLAWLVVGLFMVVFRAFSPQPLSNALGDTDDALRLVQVRDWLAGQGWFDLLNPRLQPPEGYLSHWSRLIDAGIGGLYLLFSLFTSPANAELLTRAFWPWLLMLPCLVMVVLITERIGHRLSVWFSLAFAATLLPAFMQFMPGRIDHHNVQIVLALAVIATLVRLDGTVRSGVMAGLAVGIMPAFGLENIPYLGLSLATVSLIYVRDASTWRMVRSYWLALGLAAGAGFLVTTPPSHWSISWCDVYAINLALPLMLAALAGTAIVSLARNRGTRLARLALVAALGVMFAGVYVWAEPACLRGPLGQMNLALKPIWLDRVKEFRGPVSYARAGDWSLALLQLAGPFVAIFAGLYLTKRQWSQPGTQARIIEVSALILAVLVSFSAIRMGNYAIWISVPVAAAFAGYLWDRFRPVNSLAQAALVMVCAPITFSVLALLLPTGPSEKGSDAQACLNTNSYDVLGKLPAGLVANPIDLGPFILANTHHSALVAPYHRIARGMLDSDLIFNYPQMAEATVRRDGVAWVVVCNLPGLNSNGSHFMAQARAGTLVPWLEVVPGTLDQTLAIFRVKPAVP